MTTLQVTEIMRRLEQGMTRPFLVRAEDDVLYVAKGRETTQRGLIAEWICAHLAQQLGLQVALAAMRIDQLALRVLGDGIDGQVAPRQVLLQRDIGRGMHHKAFVAWRCFAFGARQGIFLARMGVQKNRKVFAYGLIAQRCHLRRRSTHHHPVFVFDGLVQQGVANGTANTENLHRHTKL